MTKRGTVLANVITGIRILCGLSLIFCPTFSIWFYVLYLIGGVSDVLDGMAARNLGKETKFGAQLDTAADAVFAAVVMIKILRAVSVPVWLTIWIICIAVIKCISVIIGFALYKRFVPEHTVMNKICGLLLFALPLCIGQFPGLPATIGIILNCCVATVAAVQEWYYIRIGKSVE